MAVTSTAPTEDGSSRSPSRQPSAPVAQPGPSLYHESSQYRHWRYSQSALDALRTELNEKSKEVTAKNMAAEKEAQLSLGHAFTSPPPEAAYLSVDEELLLVHFYCQQASNICRMGFGLPEAVETTAITYIKRFYLKNSVMEWHPMNIMPTCIFLASKTCNHPVPIDVFVSKLKGFKPTDVLDLEFLVAQSLSFEFWVRGADKALRGWALEMQDLPTGVGSSRTAVESIQRTLPAAIERLSVSRFTDAELLYAPSQIALACFHMASAELVNAFLDWKYANAASNGHEDYTDGLVANGDGDGATKTVPTLPYGIDRAGLDKIIAEIEAVIRSAGDGAFDKKKIKEVDKRLKSCTNPEKVPGTAMYIRRKAEQEAKASEAKAEKVRKAEEARADDDLVFGAPLGAVPDKKKLDDPFV